MSGLVLCLGAGAVEGDEVLALDFGGGPCAGVSFGLECPSDHAVEAEDGVLSLPVTALGALERGGELTVSGVGAKVHSPE